MALHIAFIITLVAAAAPIKGMIMRLQLNDQIKCGGCPCTNPCYTTSPPPPPPPPPRSPPPPKMPTPAAGVSCPPPPTGGGSSVAFPGYIYITGPPAGDLYPVNPYFSGSHRNFLAAPPLLAVVGVVGMVINVF